MQFEVSKINALISYDRKETDKIKDKQNKLTKLKDIKQYFSNQLWYNKSKQLC